MTSTYQNYSSQYSPNLQEHVLFGSPNVFHHVEETNRSSSPSFSTRDFFSSITDHHQDYSGSYYHEELQQPHIQLDHQVLYIRDHVLILWKLEKNIIYSRSSEVIYI